MSHYSNQDALVNSQDSQYFGKEEPLVFNRTQVFQGYEMHFLKDNIRYCFIDGAMLKKTKYNYHVEKMAAIDLQQINRLLASIHPNMKISTDVYINGHEIKFVNKAVSQDIEFNDAIRWKLDVLIQGFKVNRNGRPSPIWKICEAHQTI